MPVKSGPHLQTTEPTFLRWRKEAYLQQAVGWLTDFSKCPGTKHEPPQPAKRQQAETASCTTACSLLLSAVTLVPGQPMARAAAPSRCHPPLPKSAFKGCVGASARQNLGGCHPSWKESRPGRIRLPGFPQAEGTLGGLEAGGQWADGYGHWRDISGSRASKGKIQIFIHLCLTPSTRSGYFSAFANSTTPSLTF